MYVCSVDRNKVHSGNKYVRTGTGSCEDEDAEILVVAAKIESEIAEFETYDERSMFLAEDRSGRIRSSV